MSSLVRGTIISIIVTEALKYKYLCCPIKKNRSLVSWRLISLRFRAPARALGRAQSSTLDPMKRSRHPPRPCSNKSGKVPKKNRKWHDVSRFDNPSSCDDSSVFLLLTLSCNAHQKLHAIVIYVANKGESEEWTFIHSSFVTTNNLNIPLYSAICHLQDCYSLLKSYDEKNIFFFVMWRDEVIVRLVVSDTVQRQSFVKVKVKKQLFHR